jgi:predicted DNA-binding transcriptional regulator YafY
MRADRLLSILLLLQVHQRMTAGELARRLEVSERTVHRDMEALSAAGIPLVAERGAGGGWSLLEPYQTRLNGLNLSEIQTLFLNQPSRLLADLGLDKAADHALVKLLAALPSVNRQTAEYVRQRIYVDAAGWNRVEEPVPCLPAIQDAIWQERRLRFMYRYSGGAQGERVVDPLGLVAKGSVWYLVAGVEGEIRTYRVSRVQEAQVLDERCRRPQGFDLAAHWQESLVSFAANLPRYPVILRVEPDLLPRMRGWGYTRIEQVDPPDADGWVRVCVVFEIEEDARLYALGCGPQVEVLEPPELRQQVIRLAEATVAHYRKDSMPEGTAAI